MPAEPMMSHDQYDFARARRIDIFATIILCLGMSIPGVKTPLEEAILAVSDVRPSGSLFQCNGPTQAQDSDSWG